MNQRLLAAVAFLVLTTNYAASQKIVPTVEWEASFGGTEFDYLKSSETTPDGGSILAGHSYSPASGSKESQNHGASDYWLVKISAEGDKEWDVSFGGSDREIMEFLSLSPDGGYLIAGKSESPKSGNKSAPFYGGESDIWLVKTDDQGRKEWDVSFGGSEWEEPRSLVYSQDGSFVLGGGSSSPISGNKEAPRYGSGFDFWFLKAGAEGTKEWDVSFGGTSSVSDLLVDIQSFPDGDYLLAGVSSSPPSGNKESPNFGRHDIWMVRSDSQGVKKWETVFGGSEDDSLISVVPTSDGGSIFLGSSYSPPSGNKESPFFGGSDAWLLKLSAFGDLVWETSLGGSDTDYLGSLRVTTDNGFLLCGNSYSTVSGNKTSPELGHSDAWLVKIDSKGNTEWDESFGGIGYEQFNDLMLTPDGGCLVGGWSDSPSSRTKNSAGYGGSDIWLVKVEDDIQLRSQGQVVAWVDSPPKVLESSSFINRGWQSHNLEPTILNHISFVPLIGTEEQRYFRTRGEVGENSSSLSIGVLLTWPGEVNSILEMSNNPAGPWEEFQGVQGQIDDQMMAIISQDQTQNYFRTRKAD